MYQIGDYVVKSARGVCKIDDIVSKDFADHEKKLYYQLMPLADANTKVYVPVDRDDNKMRAVMTEEQAQNLIRRIPEIEECWINNEKERERSYKEAIQSNDSEKLVSIIKQIYGRKKLRREQGKKTTVIDGRYFETAENLLYSELELAMKKSRSEIQELIRECCESA